VDAYARAVAARPGHARAVNDLVLALVRAGRHAEALARARARLAEAPGDPDRQYTLGLAQSEQDVAGALASFRRALTLAPRHTLARYNLALVLKRSDRLAEAAAELDEVLRLEPRAEAHYTLGVIRWQQGERDRAEAALRAAIAAEPRHADAHHTLGVVLAARRDWAGAAAALRQALALRPDFAGAHDTLARVLQRAGDADGARRHLEAADRLRARTAREQEARVWTLGGIRLLDEGDALAAIDRFRKATTLYDRYAPAGRAFQRLGQPDAARAAFARARQLNPSLVPPPHP
jgi:tetratricopeptide (TPR) repeat protein